MVSMSIAPWYFLIALALVEQSRSQERSEVATSAEAALKKTENSEITPSHVYQEMALAKFEIDLIRLEMGKPKVAAPPIRVEKAAPREVYFQALTLFRKADRLAFEHTRERVAEPSLPVGEIRPRNVRLMVIAARDRIGKVKTALDIPEPVITPALETGIEPSQVFNAIIAANAELNQLLDQKFAPGDVYKQVTTAIAYMARLIDSTGELSTPPAPPPFERRKRPADVYRKLITCFEEIHELGERSGVTMLELKVDEAQIERVEPSDVYDVASLLVSELAYLHSQRASALPPRNVYSPGKKLPSHVFQRIGILCGQMEMLQRKVGADPDWLKH